MKLSSKAYIFIAIPVFLQIAITTILLSTLKDLEKLIAKEQRAQEILSLGHQLHSCAADSAVLLTSMRFASPEETNASIDKVILHGNSICKKLRKQAALDKESANLIMEYVNINEHYFSLLKEHAASRPKERFATPEFVLYLHESTLLFDTMATIRRSSLVSKKLFRKFSKFSEEAGPRAFQERQRLKNTIIGALTINALVALVLAYYFGRTTATRLRSLMSNVERFSAHNLDLVPVPGNDEIALLDERFREMAEERQKAEDERRGVLQAVSHDIRGPVSAVSIALEGLMENCEKLSPDEIKKRLARVATQSNRTFEICKTFLDMETLEEGRINLEPAEHEAGPLLYTAIDTVAHQAETANVGIVVTNEHDIVFRCDPDRFTQVIVNLLSNAIKFAPPGSDVTVNAIESTEYTVFEISDTGCGINEEDQKKLFRKFIRSGSLGKKEGSGLGLWICKRLMELHGGTIGYKLRDGGGSTFVLTFPRSAGNPMK